MDKREYNLQKGNIRYRYFETTAKVILVISKYGFILWLVNMVISAFLITEHVDKFVELVDKFNLGDGMWAFLTTATGGGLYVCHKSKKHSKKKIGWLRKEFEKDDPNRSSSGLNSDGSTPGG